MMEEAVNLFYDRSITVKAVRAHQAIYIDIDLK